MVWSGIFKAVAADRSETSARIAYTAIGHSSPEVRRLACTHLGSHADADHVRFLTPALEDSNVVVVRAAVEALGVIGNADAIQPLERLLATANESLRVDVGDRPGSIGRPLRTARIGASLLQQRQLDSPPSGNRHGPVRRSSLRRPPDQDAGRSPHPSAARPWTVSPRSSATTWPNSPAARNSASTSGWNSGKTGAGVNPVDLPVARANSVATSQPWNLLKFFSSFS